MKNKKIVIREATQKDANALSICMKKAYAGYLERFSGLRLPPMDVDYSEEIENYPVWVIEVDAEIYGGLIMIFEKDHAVLSNIGITPDARGAGLGRKMIKFAEQQTVSRGYNEIRLVTHIKLIEIIEYYGKLGWSEYKRDETKVYFKKILN